ncbi:hypothetical protein [Cnuella takakiae]|nr:hypothetical protein [Cnuella takakiae]
MLLRLFLTLSIFFPVAGTLMAQQLTGIYRGQVGKQRAEIKFIVQGDSIWGTSYYHGLGSGYRRYSIKGYRDPYTNAIVWWDDQLLETKGGLMPGNPGKIPQASEADFNCPGGGVALLDGKSSPVDEPTDATSLHLRQVSRTQFPDEWDWVIDNFRVGANHPYIIDSVSKIAMGPKSSPIPAAAPPVAMGRQPKKGMVTIPPPPFPKEEIPAPTVPTKAVPITIEEKFVARTPKWVMDIPLRGDSIELRFYDNAEIDGDSISLFLNKELIFRHVRLTAKAHVVKLAVSSLQPSNELVMVAENLGRIPPNTSFMVALVDDRRYEANLQSTEESSALIKLVKP